MNMFESFLERRVSAMAEREKALTDSLLEAIQERDHYLKLLEDIDALVYQGAESVGAGPIKVILEGVLYA